jgi:hypothetical protein
VASRRQRLHVLARKNILFILNLIHLNDYGRKVIGNVGASFGLVSLQIGLKSRITTFLLYIF